MIGSANKTPIYPEYVTFGAPTALVGARTEVTMYALSDGQAQSRFSGQKTIRYDRIHIDTILHDLDRSIVIELPCNTNDIFDKMVTSEGWYFDYDDFVTENIPVGTQSYRLVARPDSLRWVGDTQITLLEPSLPPPVTYTHIDTLFSSTELVGFWYMDGSNNYIENYPPIYSQETLFFKLLKDHSNVFFDEESYSIESISDSNGNKNTEIVINGVNAAGYDGTVTLTYNRFNLTDFFAPEIVYFDKTDTDLILDPQGLTRVRNSVDRINMEDLSMHQAIVDLLSTTHGLYIDLSEVDIVTNSETNYTVSAKSDSIVYSGSFTFANISEYIGQGNFLDTGNGSVFGLNDTEVFDLGN